MGDEAVRDLAKFHEPVGSTFRASKQRDEQADWDKYALTPNQVDQFWEDGFLLNVPVLSENQCDLILKDIDHLFGLEDGDPRLDLMYEYHRNQSGDPTNVLMHSLGHWRVYESFHDIIFLPQVAIPTSQLLIKGHRTSVRFWHDQLFCKPARHGGVVAWHQDFSYWTRTAPMAHMTVHIALEDQTLENGTLHYIKGSHRWMRGSENNPLPVTDFDFKDMESILTILTEEEKLSFKPEPSLLKKGEASFHHPLAVHGSYGNRSDHPRRATVLNYFADGTLSNTDGDLLTPNKVFIPKGDKMEGPLFPFVYQPPQDCK